MTPLPDPFAAALAAGQPEQVADAVAATAPEHLGRALARIALGRDADARQDVETIVGADGAPLADADIRERALLELAFLDMRQRGAFEDGLLRVREIAARVPSGGALHARALHLAGWAEGKLRRTGAALDALHRALHSYRALGAEAEVGRVNGTLGEVFAARGQLDHALGHFAMSLVAKARAGDRPGMALTMGSIGRVHLAAGRYQDALDAFRADLEIADEIGDRRGRARMLNDLGRAHMGLEETDEAASFFVAALALCDDQGFGDLRPFVLKDLALCRLAHGRLDLAAETLDRAEEDVRRGGVSRVADALLLAARGAILLARGDPDAQDPLRRAVGAFAKHDLPDQEIPTRILLTRALVEAGDTLGAERCLTDALEQARAAGFVRYLAPLREEMVALRLDEAAATESDRRLAGGGDRRRESDYVSMRLLGEGAFGEVHLALDVLRNRRVAFKRLRLAEETSPQERIRIMTSIRLELDAASRIRHPGVARVFAIGTEEGGDAYVVQQFVEGESLASVLRVRAPGDVLDVIPAARRMAGALAELHRHWIVHRDLKPSNVVLRPDGTPVLIDFGIARTPREPNAFGEGALVGTLGYMSVEQAKGEAGPKSDVYALGTILYEWLTGALPRAMRREADLWELLTQEPRPIEEWRDDLPPPIVSLVRRMLATEPAERPAAEDVARECAEIVDA